MQPAFRAPHDRVNAAPDLDGPRTRTVARVSGDDHLARSPRMPGLAGHHDGKPPAGPGEYQGRPVGNPGVADRHAPGEQLGHFHAVTAGIAVAGSALAQRATRERRAGRRALYCDLARREDAPHEEDGSGQILQARSSWMRIGGDRLPAGAGQQSGGGDATGKAAARRERPARRPGIGEWHRGLPAAPGRDPPPRNPALFV